MQKLMLQLMGEFAEFERSLIRERQREGIAVANGRCQASWHVSGKNYAAFCTSWASGSLLCGLSDTDCTGNQFLVCPDHRSGWRLFAAS